MFVMPSSSQLSQMLPSWIIGTIQDGSAQDGSSFWISLIIVTVFITLKTSKVCSVLYVGLPVKTMWKLQLVQDTAHRTNWHLMNWHLMNWSSFCQFFKMLTGCICVFKLVLTYKALIFWNPFKKKSAVQTCSDFKICNWCPAPDVPNFRGEISTYSGQGMFCGSTQGVEPVLLIPVHTRYIKR